jgi:hypothetical protein
MQPASTNAQDTPAPRAVEIVLSLLVLAAAAIYPNAYVAAGLGVVQLAALVRSVLLPAVGVVLAVWLSAHLFGIPKLSRGIAVALLAGVLGTAGLDVIRVPSVLAGYLPMDEAKEIAADLIAPRHGQVTPAPPANEAAPTRDTVTTTQRAPTHEDQMRDTMPMPQLTPAEVTVGYLYHYWNGVSFALVFVILFGRVPWWGAVLYATFFVDAGMMVAMPRMMHMGLPAPAWIAALLAHLGYGTGSLASSRPGVWPTPGSFNDS